jgi:hypothetical protein
MVTRIFASTVFIVVGFVAAGGARAEDFDIAGHRLVIEPMEGYCPVGHTDPADQSIYAMTDEAASGALRTLSVQGDCAALDAFRKDSSIQPDILPALVFQLGLLEGEEKALPMTREKFLEIMDAALQSQHSDEIRNLARQSEQAATVRLQEKTSAALAEMTPAGPVVLGMLDRDELGVYIGFVEAIDRGGKADVNAGVGATTMVNGLPLTVTRTERYASVAQFRSITAELKRVLRAFVTWNEGAM